MQIAWIAQLMASSKPHWGFVCFRTAYDSDEAWAKHKEHILCSSRVGLCAFLGTCSVIKKWRIHFVENDKERLNGANLEDLCKCVATPLVMHESSADMIRYFKDPPPSSSISSALSSSLRSDNFLLADACAISSLNDPPSDPWPEGLIPAPSTQYRASHSRLHQRLRRIPRPVKNLTPRLQRNPQSTSRTYLNDILPQIMAQRTREGNRRLVVLRAKYRDDAQIANGSSSREGGVYPPHEAELLRWAGDHL